MFETTAFWPEPLYAKEPPRYVTGRPGGVGERGHEATIYPDY
jgi:hypothetical protein